MNVAYRVKLTEYESGMGQRDDGCVYSLTKEQLQAKVQQICQSGDYHCYVRADSPELVLISSELAAMLGKFGIITTIKGKHEGELATLKEYKDANKIVAAVN